MQGNEEILIKVQFTYSWKKEFIRHCLDLNKSEYFLDFIFSGGMLEDVACGITKIKHDFGEEQKIVYAILTTKLSHAIAFWKLENCYFLPLSESSFWKILQRKSLAGLDDMTIWNECF